MRGRSCRSGGRNLGGNGGGKLIGVNLWCPSAALGRSSLRYRFIKIENRSCCKSPGRQLRQIRRLPGGGAEFTSGFLCGLFITLIFDFLCRQELQDTCGLNRFRFARENAKIQEFYPLFVTIAAFSQDA